MKNSLTKSQPKVILRTFLIILASVILLTASASVLLFAHSYNEQTLRRTQNKLQRISELFASENATAKSSLMRISVSQHYRDLISGEISSENYPWVLVELSNLYTDPGEIAPEAFFYICDYKRELVFSLNTMQKVFSFQEFFDLDLLELLPGLQKEDKFRPMLRSGIPNLPEKVMTYVYFEGGELTYQNCAIVVNFDISWLLEQSTGILDETDDLYIFSAETLAAHTDRLSLPASAVEALASGEDPADLDYGKNLFVNSFSSNGFTFFLFSDIWVANQPLYRIYLLLALCAVAIILLAASISFPLSKSILRKLETRFLQNAPQPAIVQLLTKINELPPDANIDLYSSGFPQKTLQGKICILIFHLDSWQRINDPFTKNQIDLICFGICNITEEVFSDLCATKSFPLKNFIVTALSDFEGDLKNRILQKIREVQSFVRKQFRLTFSASVSCIGPFSEIQDIYYDVRMFSENSFYAPDNAMLTGEEFSEEGKPLPSTILIESLSPINSLDIEKIKSFLSVSVFQPLRERRPSVTYTKQLLANLLAQLTDSLYNFSERYSIDLTEQIEAFSSLPSRSYKLSEYAKNLFEELDKLKVTISTVIPGLSNKNKQIVSRTEDIIAHQYQDPNLTVNTIANEINLSPMYLCKIFKSCKNVQLNTYLCEFRLERAAELLRTTDHTTKVISEQCGFINTNYFYTLFKKYKKMTAKEYQNMYRESAEKHNVSNEEKNK